MYFFETNKSLILNTIIFFFIVVVVLNFTKNYIDVMPYKKADVQINNQDAYFKVSNEEIKKELSTNFLTNEFYKIITERECIITGDFHDRHKVRWLKALFLKNIFTLANNFSEKLPYYINIILHSFFIFLSLYVLNKTFNFEHRYNYIFLIYITFLFQQHLSEYSYSIFEMFFLSMALYASKNKKHFLFFGSCLLAILNRESGFLIILTWLIFNNNDYKKVIYFIFASGLIFFAVNFDILKCLLNPKFFIPLESQKGQVNISDVPNINVISLGKLVFVNFLLPFGLYFYYLFFSKNKNKILIILSFIYFLIFVFATPLHHISVRMILLPLIFTAIYFYESEKKYTI